MSLQSKVLKILKQLPDVWVIKVQTANERGCPDILCCAKGVFIAIEIKEGDDKVSPIQEEQLRLIKKAGGAAIVVRDLKDLQGYIG